MSQENHLLSHLSPVPATTSALVIRLIKKRSYLPKLDHRVWFACIVIASLALTGVSHGQDNVPAPNREAAATETGVPIDPLVVTSTADGGEGSLRQAILKANAQEGPVTITFDGAVFAEPQTIALSDELPEITAQLTIDGYIQKRLWKATGVTVSGDGRFPVFRVSLRGHLTLRNFTIAESCADAGAGVTNLGELVVSGVTFRDNEATMLGGAILNLGGAVTVINSTFARNRAAESGGGLANLGGVVTITNSTFSENAAPEGAGLFSDGELLLRNTILANSEDGMDCVALLVDSASTNNLIEAGDGCGTPISTADPRLEPLGYFNGPAQTYPLRGGSHAINLGDNAAALDEHGLPLVWDQRGNGDPRFVAGYTDIGAFEYQRHPVLKVDTVDDSDLRACTLPGRGDCPLRGAIELANEKDTPQIVTFDPKVFTDQRTILLTRPLPKISNEITLDATGPGGVTLAAEGEFPLFEHAPGDGLHLVQVTLAEPDRESSPN